MVYGERRRGQLKLNQRLTPRQMLILGTLPMAMVLAIDMVDMVLDTLPIGHTMADTMADIEDMVYGERRRGQLKLNPRLTLRLMLILGTLPMAMVLAIDMVDMVLDTLPIGHTMVDTMADIEDMVYGERRRGPLKLNPRLMLRLMLILGTLPMAMVLDTMDMVDMVLDMLPIGHTMVDTMVDIEDTGERSKPSR